MVPGSNWRSQSSRLDDPDGVSARLAQHPEREGYRIEGDSALGALTLKTELSYDRWQGYQSAIGGVGSARLSAAPPRAAGEAIPAGGCTCAPLSS